jgi:hypothetical protein
VGTAPESAQDPGEFFGKIATLLDQLVPPSSVTITRADGSTVDLPGAIPARRQVVVFRLLRDLLDLPQVSTAMSGLGSQLASGNVADTVVALATDLEVAEALGGIFSAAYPHALGEGEDPLDVLPLEEVVLALVPFSERFVKALGGGLVVLGTGAAALN